jgi:hypothetical protein
MKEDNLKDELFTVPGSFIKEAYEAACPKWREKLEKMFPALFPVNLIGEGYYHDGITPADYVEGKDGGMERYRTMTGTIVSVKSGSRTVFILVGGNTIWEVRYKAENLTKNRYSNHRPAYLPPLAYLTTPIV